MPFRQTGDNDIIFANAPTGVEIRVVGVVLRCVVFLVEHLLRGRQLNRQRAHLSHRVVFAAQLARHLRSLRWSSRRKWLQCLVYSVLWVRSWPGSLAAAQSDGERSSRLRQAEAGFRRTADVAADAGEVWGPEQRLAHWLDMRSMLPRRNQTRL